MSEEKKDKFDTCSHRSPNKELHGTRCGYCPNLGGASLSVKETYFCHRRGLQLNDKTDRNICECCSKYSPKEMSEQEE